MLPSVPMVDTFIHVAISSLRILLALLRLERQCLLSGRTEGPLSLGTGLHFLSTRQHPLEVGHDFAAI